MTHVAAAVSITDRVTLGGPTVFQAWEVPTSGMVAGVDVCEVEGVVVAVVTHATDDELKEEVEEAEAEVAAAAAINRAAKLSPGHAVDASLLPADRVNAYSVAVSCAANRSWRHSSRRPLVPAESN